MKPRGDLSERGLELNWIFRGRGGIEAYPIRQ